MSAPPVLHPNDSNAVSNTDTPSPILIRLPEVKRRTGLGRSAIYARVKLGDFPQPVPLTAHAVAWVAAEVDRWCEARIAARDARAVS
jgi:prophage regulatory protein